VLSLLLTLLGMRPLIDCHASLRLSCSCNVVHQQKILSSGGNGCVRVDALRQSRQRHPGGGLLHARHQYYALCCIAPSDRRFAVSSHSVGRLFTLALWPAVTILRNGFIGYTLASELQCVTLRKPLLTFLLHLARGV
jgi:hypothetical protein